MYNELILDFEILENNNIKIEYNGKNFIDWWNQDEGEELEDALDLILQEQIKDEIEEETSEEIEVCLCYLDATNKQITVSVESY